jgi:hypothetical protein
VSFYSDNELIAYPLVGNDDYQIPQDLIVDCIVHAPSSLGTLLSVKSLSCTDLLVSVVLQIDGEACAYLTVPLTDVVLHQPVALTSIADGVSGFIAFGAGVHRSNLRVDGAYEMMPECLISYEFDTTNPTTDVLGHALRGLVKLDVGPNLLITATTLRIRKEDLSIVETPCALISVADESIYDDPIPGCLRPAEGSPIVTPIRQINGVRPDCSTGDITLQFVNLREIPTDPGVTVVETAQGLTIQDEGEPCSS